MLCGCFGAILPGKAELAGAGKVLIICTRGDKGHKGILGCPAQPKLASHPCPKTTCHSPPPQQAPWMSAVSRTHPHRVPIQSGSPGHPPGRAKVSINMAPAILSSTAGRGGQEAQQFQNLPPLCAPLALWAIGTAAPWTSQQLEGRYCSQPDLQVRKLRHGERKRLSKATPLRSEGARMHIQPVSHYSLCCFHPALN